MHALDGALEEFEMAPTTAVTVVDRTTSAQLLAERGGRRPEDARAERIVLRHTSQTLVTFWGASAWRLADVTLVTWAEMVRLGRTATVAFEVKFGDGTSYEGEIPIARGIRRGRARLAEHCRRLETFGAAFCPSTKDERKISAMLNYFLQNYEIGEPLAATQRTRTRKATPESTPIQGSDFSGPSVAPRVHEERAASVAAA